mgnify:CR=1 FL=1
MLFRSFRASAGSHQRVLHQRMCTNGGTFQRRRNKQSTRSRGRRCVVHGEFAFLLLRLQLFLRNMRQSLETYLPTLTKKLQTESTSSANPSSFYVIRKEALKDRSCCLMQRPWSVPRVLERYRTEQNSIELLLIARSKASVQRWHLTCGIWLLSRRNCSFIWKP